MASEKLHPGAKVHAVDPKRITLRIFPNAALAPTWDSEGGVASVAYTAAGKFTVTLNEPYFKPIACAATVQCNGDAVDLYAQLGDFNNVGRHNGAARGTPGQPTTFVVKLKTGATNTDAAAAAQTAIFVDVTFEDVDRAS
jgi:hypothetical protein